MTNVTLVAVLSVLLSILAGCSNCQPVQPLFVQGEVPARIGSKGTLLRSSASRNSRVIGLERPGDSQCIAEDEPFVLSMPTSIDMAEYAIQIEDCDSVTAGQKIYKITLVETCKKVLALTKHCQRVNWYNPYRIPEIRVKNEDLDQLVLTPLIGTGNTIVGYEVRLGDVKGADKCLSPALDALDRFRSKGLKIRRAASTTRKKPGSPELFLEIQAMG
jgi:hypothetical protein